MTDPDEETTARCQRLLLKGGNLNELPDWTPWVNHLKEGEYRAVVESELILHSLEKALAVGVDTKVVSRLGETLGDRTEGSLIEQFEVLIAGLSCLQAFIQVNWTGPLFERSERVRDLVLDLVSERQDDDEETVRSALIVDGEEIVASISQPELLVLALAFLSCPTSLVSRQWWLMRALYVYQQILEEDAPTLLEELTELGELVEETSLVQMDPLLNVILSLELSRIHLHYGRVSDAEKRVNRALNLLDMNVSFSGALGRRTQYQGRDIAQLTLKVEVDKVPDSEGLAYIIPPIDSFVKDQPLNDDVRLRQVTFVDPDEGAIPDLAPIALATLIGMFVLKKKSQAKDPLQNEVLKLITQCLLGQPKVWSVHAAALLFRSRIERGHKRTLERSLLQTQELMNLSQLSATLPDRLHLFYCSFLPPAFRIASECASILVSVGSIQSALDVYLKLQQWESVISCYNFLNLRHKAAEVIKTLMSKHGRTVKLLCSLGNATGDIACYEIAWELSNYRSAQAQRDWALYFFHRKRYEEAIPHFKKSLEINSLQVTMWFQLGYAALMELKWDESAAAYRRFCSLEPEHFEAWNNLAKAYIRLGQKQRACYALQEAVKCNYDMWQVWDNLMAVSCDCGDFEEVIRCYHRILDLKDRHMDELVLKCLSTAVVKDTLDCRDRPCSHLRKKALELFGRITSKTMGNAIIWQLYAELTSSIEEQTPITKTKTAQYYHKAYMVAVQDIGTFKDVNSLMKLISISRKLADARLNEGNSQSLGSLKLTLENTIARINQRLTDFEEVSEEFQNQFSELEKILEKLK